MAIGTVQPPRSRAERDLSPDRIIDRQLRRTQLQVRLVDLAASLAVWLAALLASLLVLAVCDHWLVSIGPVGRWLALLAIVAASGWYFATQLGPLVLRRINSAYAAKVIEEAEPSLKNSILNFLLLRGSRTGVPEVVVDALRERAALDITRVPVDHAVDRTPLIRLGYVLCGVMVLFAAYKLLSPKDPFRTVARVFAPWAEIARPSRVQITAVEPGHAEVYQGQSVAITAGVEGVRGRDAVEIVYSTADGQTIDAIAPMQAAGGLRYRASLPPGSESSGLQQNIVYRVRAGDAESPAYELRVLPSPRITVERVELHFPPYTKREPQVLNQGDLRAVEGTRAIVHAKANQEIASAYFEFDPSGDVAPRRIPTLNMKAEGTTAAGEFRLERLRDGSARYTSYRVRFVSPAGLQDDRPTLHRIEALADLAPEIEVLSPMERRVELPLDRTLKVELRGRDPDFGLRKITLELAKVDVPLESMVLLDQEQGRLGPANVSFTIAPAKLGLQSGDELRFAGVAEDNRHDAQGALSPNVSRTDRYVVVITPPEATERKQNDTPRDDGDTGEKNDDRGPMPNKNASEQQPDQPEKSDQPMKDRDAGEPMDSAGQKNDGSSKPEKSDTNSGSKEKPGSKTGEKSQQTGEQGGEGEQQEGNQSEEGSNASGSQGESGSSKSTKERGSSGASGSESQGEDSSGDSGEGDSPEGSSGAKNNSKTGSQQGKGSRPSEGGEEGSAQSGEPQEGEGTGQRPKHDGEVFDETLKRIREQQEKSGEAGSKPSGDKSGGQSEQGTSAAQNPGEKTGQPMTGDQASGEETTGEQTGDQESGAGKQASQPGEKKNERPQSPSASGDKSNDQGDAAAGEEPGSPMESEGGNEPKENASSSTGGAGKQSDPGSGRQPNKPNPTGDPQTPGRDTPKTPKPEGGKPKSDETSASPSGRKQSDSQGDTSGDQTGGGGQGAGQSAKKPGNDSPGSSQSADSGSGASSEEGKGETGDKAGSDQKANRATGQSGTEEGPGSKPKPGASGSKPSPQESGTSEGGGAQQGEQAAKSPKRDPSKQGASDGTVSGGGVASEGEPQPIAKKPQEIADTEAENLEYAKKSTELALKYLKDQKDNPDPELLKRLGWTKDELEAFVRRWELLKDSAKEDTETREELDDAYRSLGLRPAGDKRRSAGAGDDAARSLRDAGARSEPPSSYAEQFRAFRKGAGQK